jgi:hypothetical protein
MKLKYILLILIILILGAAGAYWYYFMSGTSSPEGEDTSEVPSSNGFVPFDRNNQSNVPNATTSASPSSNTNNPATTTTSQPVVRPPKLRLLSNTPVGGYGASTTLANRKLAIEGTTVVRWADRGRGNIYEARGDSSTIETLSNTVVPRIIDSAWNSNVSSFVAAMLAPNEGSIDLVFSQLRPQTGTSSAPFALRGSTIHGNVITYAISPRQDRLFALIDEGGNGVGYVSGLDGKGMVKLFTTPLTQLTAEWPEENTIAITTNASANQEGFLYFVNPKTGSWRKIAGPLRGLTTSVSRDAKYALITVSKGDASTLSSTILDVAKKTEIDANLSTLPQKCVWGNFYKNMLYCGVPTVLPEGIYPNEWHLGTMSFKDKIWQINATTGDLKLISDLTKQADRSIDAYRMGLDRNDNYLFFINKNDLSFWSLDLVTQ